MKIVADTNIFLATVLNEPSRQAIIANTRGCELLAPDVLPYELGNALSAMVKRGGLSNEQALQTLKAIEAIKVRLQATDIAAGLSLALDANIYAYDGYFLQCAISHKAPILTLDQRMQRVATDLGITVMEL